MGGPLVAILATQEYRESGAFLWSVCKGNGINESGWRIAVSIFLKMIYLWGD